MTHQCISLAEVTTWLECVNIIPHLHHVLQGGHGLWLAGIAAECLPTSCKPSPVMPLSTSTNPLAAVCAGVTRNTWKLTQGWQLWLGHWRVQTLHKVAPASTFQPWQSAVSPVQTGSSQHKVIAFIIFWLYHLLKLAILHSYSVFMFPVSEKGNYMFQSKETKKH